MMTMLCFGQYQADVNSCAHQCQIQTCKGTKYRSQTMFTKPIYSLFFIVILLYSCASSESTIPEVDGVNCSPQQVHIAYGDQVSDVTIIWSTIHNCSTRVDYGTSEWLFDHSATGTSLNFTAYHSQGIPILHRVVLQNLMPSTTYFYRPLSNNASAGPYYFKTPPSDQDWAPLFLVYGDLGIKAQSIPYLTRETLTGLYTATLHLGDFAYDMKDDGGRKGDVFMQLIEEFASHLPYMTSPGNHEIEDDTFSNYRYRFSMPHTDWPIPINKMWYSFNVGPIHFISYSSEVFFTSNGQYVKTQHDWLVRDLKEANKNRHKCPWVIAFGHRPMYCSNDNGDDCTKNDSLVRNGFEDIFYHYGVDVVLQAHEHSYERLWPMYRGVVLAHNYSNPAAPVQIIGGAAGGGKVIDTISTAPPNDWSAFRMGNRSLDSFGRLHVLNSTHLYWEQVSVFGGELLDSVWIIQEQHGPNNRDTLPQTISKEIDKAIESSSRPVQPVDVETNNEQTTNSVKAKIYANDATQRIAIGASFGVLIVLIIAVAVIVKGCRRQRRKTRRWETMDFNYGKKFYQPAKDSEPDVDNDFEIDMSDGTLPTTKLLTGN